MPACAQTAHEPRIAFTAPRTETRVTLDERGRGLWLRAATVTRTESEQGGADGRTGYRVSLQTKILGHTWFGLGASAQLPRFDPARGIIRGGHNSVGARLSFEASPDVEMGFAWMKRVRGRMIRGGPKPGPRAYVQLHF